jgi:hypothetical protein
MLIASIRPQARGGIYWTMVSIRTLADRIVRFLQRDRNPSKSEPVILVLGEVQLDKAALHSNDYGLSSIIGAELRQNVRDVALDGRSWVAACLLRAHRE